MSATVTCACGAQYQLKDDYAGHALECAPCHAVIAAPGGPARPRTDPAFGRDDTRREELRRGLQDKKFAFINMGYVR